MTGDPVEVDGKIIYDVGQDIAQKTRELSRTQATAMRDQVHEAQLDRDRVRNAIADKIKEFIAALDDAPQDHASSDG